MPLPGGPADKFGNRYEGRWTVSCLLRILDEKARSIHLEPVGPEGQGVEFYLTQNNGDREYHQVKRQHGGGGAWTIALLAERNVLCAFQDKLTSSSARCAFVSTTSAGELQTLIEHAEKAEDVGQFRGEFLKAQRLGSWFDSLRQKWADCSDQQAYEWLQRISVYTESENLLVPGIERDACALVKGDPKAVRVALAELVLDSIHEELDAVAIWAYLKECGYQRRRWNNDPHLLLRIQEANERYLSPIQGQAILGKAIERQEVAAILARLNANPEKRAVLVTGGAGSGKSGVLAQFMELAESHGWLVMGFRMDRLEPVGTARQLGEQLDLPESPVHVLNAAAGDRRCLLVIDQLDAVSTTSGRHPAFFERVEELIRQFEVCPHMRLVLSCRSFDRDNDSRLRRLSGKQGVAEEVTVESLSEAVIADTVKQCGLDPERFSAQQMDLLSVPLHLKLFTEIAPPEEECKSATIGFQTLEDLYGKYEKQKRRAIDDRLGRPVQWAAVLDVALDRMMKTQSLSMLAGPLESQFGQDVSALVSEGVMVKEGKGLSSRLSFFHETLFDYQFALSFARRETSLCEFIRRHGQHLFLRATVRQILTYMRACKDPTYLADLNELITADDIRFHIKHLVFSWVRALPDPTRDEWCIVRDWISMKSGDVAKRAWTTIWSPAWFDLLEELGYIQSELETGDDSREERMLTYLDVRVRDRPDRIARIALSWLDRSEPWPQRAWSILARMDLSRSYQCVKLYLRLLESGVAPIEQNPLHYAYGSSDVTTFPITYELEQNQPEWALEVFQAWLKNLIRHYERRDESNPFGEPMSDRVLLASHDHVLDRLARSIPDSFTKSMLPIVLGLATRNASRENSPPWADRIWGERIYGDDHRLQGELFRALVHALGALPPSGLAPYTDTLEQHIDLETSLVLLAHCYTAHGAHFADSAAQFLLADDARLQLGSSDSPYWISRKLLEAITPHCSDDLYQRLDRHILAYYPNSERAKPRFQGRAQLALLNGLAPARRSGPAARRLGELHRKFDRQDTDPPRANVCGSLGPPVDARWNALGDDDWLRLITKYDNNDLASFDWVSMRGGAEELARELEKRVKRKPERFAKLFLREEFRNAHRSYHFDVLRGLAQAETKIDAQIIWNVLRRCHEMPGRPLGRGMESLICAYLHEDIPADILAMIGWYATQAQDPQSERWQTAEEVEHAGLNSDRGNMAWAIAKILFANYTYMEQLSEALEHMVADPCISVRSQVVHALLPILNEDRDKAIELFLRLCDTDNDALLAGDFVYQFLYHANYTHFMNVSPILDRMLSADHTRVQEHGAKLICLAAVLGHSSAMVQANEYMEWPVHMRRVAAEVAAANLTHASGGAWCIHTLTRLFNDDEEEVRRTAGFCFRQLEGGEVLLAYSDLIDAYLESRSFPDDAYRFFRALQRSSAELPDVVCRAFERMVQCWRDAGDHQSPHWNMPPSSDRILLRVYDHTRSQEVKSRCLDIIDNLLLYGGFDLEQSLMARAS